MDDDMSDDRSRILPKKTSEKVAFLVTISGIPLVFLFELLVVSPRYFTYFSNAFWFHIFVFLFIAQNIFTNLFKMLTVDASGRSSKLPHILYPGWKYCYICKLNAPPRSYHCHVCNECILKQDHHSLFAGKCVGYHNQRYYVIMVLYLWLVAMYAIWFHSAYCWSVLSAGKCVGYHNQRYYVIMVLYLWLGAMYAIWFHSAYCWSVLSVGVDYVFGVVLMIIFPQMAFLLRFISAWQFQSALVLMTSLYAFVISTYLAVYQLLLIYRGQSHLEMREGIRQYDMGWRRNVRDVLGQRWLAVWLSGLVNSPLDGDGLKFNQGSVESRVKRL